MNEKERNSEKLGLDYFIKDGADMNRLMFFVNIPLTLLTGIAAYTSIVYFPDNWNAVVYSSSTIIISFFIFLVFRIWKRSLENKDINRNVGTSKLIYEQRKKIWESSYKGEKEVNNLLRSLVYPASSLYSVSVFVVGYEDDEFTHMLFMRTEDKNGREQEFDILGERMPINSLPHNYAKMLVKNHLHDYKDKEIVFSTTFHKDYLDFKEGIADEFTKQVPLPYRIQEESNSQSDGSPFFLDFIYVLEVEKLEEHNGAPQSDLKAEWINLEYVKKICMNGASPTRYNKESEKGKMYIKFKSQVKYAESIAKAYKNKKKEHNHSIFV